MTRFEPAGREFMGQWYRRELDYPERLVNTAPNETGAENPFWRCRQCESREHERMAGIFWCVNCARARREGRAKEFANSPAEVERRAAISAETVKRHAIVDDYKPKGGLPKSTFMERLRRDREGSGKGQVPDSYGAGKAPGGCRPAPRERTSG